MRGPNLIDIDIDVGIELKLKSIHA